jgi:hypothetical protein
MRVRVYLRQPLFSLPDAAGHAPATAVVLGAELLEQSPGGLKVRVSSWFDEKGRTLQGEPRTLLLPAAKVDHVWIEEESA